MRLVLHIFIGSLKKESKKRNSKEKDNKVLKWYFGFAYKESIKKINFLTHRTLEKTMCNRLQQNRVIKSCTTKVNLRELLEKKKMFTKSVVFQVHLTLQHTLITPFTVVLPNNEQLNN